jgi:hypothetical protein
LELHRDTIHVELLGVEKRDRKVIGNEGDGGKSGGCVGGWGVGHREPPCVWAAAAPPFTA